MTAPRYRPRILFRYDAGFSRCERCIVTNNEYLEVLSRHNHHGVMYRYWDADQVFYGYEKKYEAITEVIERATEEIARLNALIDKLTK